MTDWERCAPWLAAALEHSIGGWSLDDVKGAVERGEAQFWPGERSAAVTTVEIYPRGKVLEGVFCGGDGDELVEVVFPRAEAWAAGEGCVEVHITGRLGWARRLKSSGYAPLYTVLRKEIA